MKWFRDSRTLLAWLLLGVGASEMVGCRQYDRYAIELRDAQTHAAVRRAVITTRYDFRDEVIKPVFMGKHTPRNYETMTDGDGRACAKVERGIGWWFQIEAAGCPMHVIRFDADGGLNHSLWTFEVHDGWIRAQPLFTNDPGSLDVSVERVEKP